MKDIGIIRIIMIVLRNKYFNDVNSYLGTGFMLEGGATLLGTGYFLARNNKKAREQIKEGIQKRIQAENARHKMTGDQLRGKIQTAIKNNRSKKLFNGIFGKVKEDKNGPWTKFKRRATEYMDNKTIKRLTKKLKPEYDARRALHKQNLSDITSLEKRAKKIFKSRNYKRAIVPAVIGTGLMGAGYLTAGRHNN